MLFLFTIYFVITKIILILSLLVINRFLDFIKVNKSNFYFFLLIMNICIFLIIFD